MKATKCTFTLSANSLIQGLWMQRKNTKKRLADIDKQHNFIILRTLQSGNYETEMNRSMILENLHHIYESLCFSTETTALNPYRERKHIDFTNKKIKSCQDCGGSFSLKDGSAELTCVNCGPIEILDGTAFAMQKKHTMLEEHQENTRLNIDVTSFSIVVIYYQNDYPMPNK